MNMISKGPVLHLLRRRRGFAVAVALLASGGLTAAPSAHAGTYKHYSLNYAGYANADGWRADLDTLGHGFHAAAMLPDRFLGSWNVGGDRGGFVTSEYTSAIYAAPANTTVRHVSWTDRVSGLTGGPWRNVVTDATHALYSQTGAANIQVAHDDDAS